MMHQRKILNVSGMPLVQRYGYFLRKAADFEQVWGLYNEGWASMGTADVVGLPFWPEAVFAERCASDQWMGFLPRAIPIEDLVTRWLGGMHEDGKIAVIFPTPAAAGCAVSAAMLASDLKAELQQYI